MIGPGKRRRVAEYPKNDAKIANALSELSGNIAEPDLASSRLVPGKPEGPFPWLSAYVGLNP
jgi:hypothetical protein